jgi:hypothetical protein
MPFHPGGSIDPREQCCLAGRALGKAAHSQTRIKRLENVTRAYCRGLRYQRSTKKSLQRWCFLGGKRIVEPGRSQSDTVDK